MQNIKHLLSLCILVIGMITARADTVDYWHVYYNDLRIRQYPNSGDSNVILILQDNIQLNDSIFIRYYRDTPCSDCATYLVAEDDNGRRVLTSKGHGTGHPVGFSVKQLFEREYMDSTIRYALYYYEDNKYTTGKTVVCNIQFTLSPPVDPYDDETWLLVMGIFLVCVMMVCIIVGLVVTALAFFAVTALVALGILSASLLIGLWRKSFRKGLKAFLLLSGGGAGSAGGAIVLPVIKRFFFQHLHLPSTALAVTGVLGGLAGGCLTGYLCYKLTGWLVGYFRKKLRIA